VSAKPVAGFLSISRIMERNYPVLRWRSGRTKPVAVDFCPPVAKYQIGIGIRIIRQPSFCYDAHSVSLDLAYFSAGFLDIANNLFSPARTKRFCLNPLTRRENFEADL